MKKSLIGVVIVIVVLAGGYVILHKTSTKTASTSTLASTNSYGSSSSSSTGSSTGQSATATSGSIIQTKTSSSVGQYLADANGAALYTYGGDTSGVSNCSGSCVANWPIYQASSTTSLPANVTVIKRSDGTSQYAYKGMPLYTFTGDSSGQVTGDGVSNFHVAKP
jgi:predicted lipoprotein with Yx(FWY)xxD motif